MKPLMELSSTLDTYRPDSAQLFRSISAGSNKLLLDNESKYFLFLTVCLQGIYLCIPDLNEFYVTYFVMNL